MKTPRLLLALVLMAAGVVASAGPSMAHTDVLSSSPVAGAALTQAPIAVVLTFNEDLLSATAAVSIVDASGTVLPADPAQVNGAILTAPWPVTATAGTYVVAYRVVSGDGHPVTGSIGLRIEAVAGAATIASAPATDPASPNSGAASTPPWPLIAIVIVIVIALAALVGIGVIASRRRIGHR